jgi:hypothetical protein
MKSRSVSFAFVIFKLVFVGDALNSSQTDSNQFVVVQKGQIPTSGTTTLQVVSSKSAINCGTICQQISGQTCDGFLFHEATCGVGKDVISNQTRTCQLMSFTSLSNVSMGPSMDACQNFYVRQSKLRQLVYGE